MAVMKQTNSKSQVLAGKRRSQDTRALLVGMYDGIAAVERGGALLPKLTESPQDPGILLRGRITPKN